MIEFKDVWLSFGNQEVLRGVSFHAPVEQITALAGASGSGKSTVLKLVMGFMCPDRGAIIIDGEDVSNCDERHWKEVRRKMGMVFQNSALFDSMSVLQNVGFYPHYVEGQPWGKVKRAVLDVLGEVGLVEHAHKMPDELSGGMKRRVALARSLIYRPKILLYDEPTTGLDPAIIEVVNELILEMNEKYGVTSIVVSHDLECIHAVADKVVLLSNGESRDLGPPGEMLRSRDPLVEAFTAGWRAHIREFAGKLDGG